MEDGLSNNDRKDDRDELALDNEVLDGVVGASSAGNSELDKANKRLEQTRGMPIDQAMDRLRKSLEIY